MTASTNRSLGLAKDGLHGGNWRVSLDRAWRSAEIRKAFESECGLAPLAAADKTSSEQAFSGFAKTYHERFLIWATKYLGLEEQAPTALKNRLSSKS
jgi:hypothetical protein